MKLKNKCYLLRHGEALSNVNQVISSWPEKFENPLTERGIGMIKEAAEKLLGKQIDLIFSSDLLRTKQTSEIVGETLKIEPEFDKRLREISFGIMNAGPISDLDVKFKKEEERINKSMPEGESYEDVLKRVRDFLEDIDKKNKGKNILVVSHECPLWVLEGFIKGWTLPETLVQIPREERIHKGQIKELN